MENSIGRVFKDYLSTVVLSRSVNTARTYRHALRSFAFVLEDRGLRLEENVIQDLSEDSISWFATELKQFSPATEQLYLTAVKGLFEYIAAEKLAPINLPRIRLLIRQRSRRLGIRLPSFPREEIEKIIIYAINLAATETEDSSGQLRNLRDRAFILTLADTGLRVHEACNLRRGDIDWLEGRSIIIGKGDKQAVVRFSTRSMAALQDYLRARAKLDGASGRQLASLPVFARHDRGAGKKIKSITTTTGRNIITQRVREALGEQFVGLITPHSFRHYFVTTVLRASGNLKLAQKLARHQSIAVTQRYAHLSDDELDRGYHDIFS